MPPAPGHSSPDRRRTPRLTGRRGPARPPRPPASSGAGPGADRPGGPGPRPARRAGPRPRAPCRRPAHPRSPPSRRRPARPPGPHRRSHRLTATPSRSGQPPRSSGRPPADPHRDAAGPDGGGHHGQAGPALVGRLEGDAVGLVLRPAQAVAGPEPGDQPAAADDRPGSTSTATSTSSGTRPTRATRVPMAMVEVEAATAPRSGADERAGRSGSAHRPQVVEAEHAVDARAPRPGGRPRGRASASSRELRQGDADLHRPPSSRRRGPGRSRRSTRPGPSARAGRWT